MKISYTALTLAALLVPAATFADDFGRGSGRGLSVQEKFERDHPRRPSTYCHRHRHRLHGDDKRRHCHNWNRESWRSAHGRGGGFFDRSRRVERRDHWGPRYERRREIWRHDHPRPRYEHRAENRRRHDTWRRDRFGANHHRRGGGWWGHSSNQNPRPRGPSDRLNRRWR